MKNINAKVWRKKNENKVGKFLASTLSIILSLNAIALAHEKNQDQSRQPQKQEISSNIKKDSKKHSAKNLGTGLAIGGAVCLGIERLVTGKWFPLIRACIPHHSHDRNVLVVSRNEKARRKFTRIMFEGTGDLGYFTREYTFAPENGAESRFLPINYFVNYGYDENLCPASDDIQNGYHLDIETGERWGFECIVVAVDGDEKRMQSLLYDVTNLLSSVCWTWRSRTSKIIIAIIQK